MFDITSAKMISIAPSTYCLFDNFGAGRKPVLFILEKYSGKKSINSEEAKEINDTLHISEFIDKIGHLSSPNNFGYRINLPTNQLASNDPKFLPFQTSELELLASRPVLMLTLSAFELAIPPFAQYLKDNPDLFDLSPKLQDYAARVKLRIDVIDASAVVIDNKLCKDLSCNSVQVNNDTVRLGKTGNGNCTPEQKSRYQESVENNCGAAKSCFAGDTIQTLNQKISRASS